MIIYLSASVVHSALRLISSSSKGYGIVGSQSVGIMNQHVYLYHLTLQSRGRIIECPNLLSLAAPEGGLSNSVNFDDVGR